MIYEGHNNMLLHLHLSGMWYLDYKHQQQWYPYQMEVMIQISNTIIIIVFFYIYLVILILYAIFFSSYV